MDTITYATAREFHEARNAAFRDQDFSHIKHHPECECIACSANSKSELSEMADEMERDALGG